MAWSGPPPAVEKESPTITIIEDGGPHLLIDPPSPAYSNVTVRRAFIVWMHCGQVNKFKDVCNYYHYLEAFEDNLTPEKRAASRHHEFDMFCNPPPTSSYLVTLFPKLYSNAGVEPYYIKKLESIKNEKCIFKLEGFHEIEQKGVTTTEIIETSQIIRRYCKTKMIPLRKFLEEYRKYARHCRLSDTIYNVTFYIKRKMVHAELDLIANSSHHHDYLHATVNSCPQDNSVQCPETPVECENEISEGTDINIVNNDEAKTTKLLHGENNNNNKCNGTSAERKEANAIDINKEQVNNNSKTNSNHVDQRKKPLKVKKYLNKSEGNTPHNSTYPKMDTTANGYKVHERKYNSSADFFQSFKKHPQKKRLNSNSKIEDFVKLYDQNTQKSKSVECLNQNKENIVDTLGFASQDYFDASMTKLGKQNRFRKI